MVRLRGDIDAFSSSVRRVGPVRSPSQIGLHVAVRGVRALVPEPQSDIGERDAGLEQVHGRCVPLSNPSWSPSVEPQRNDHTPQNYVQFSAYLELGHPRK